MITKEKNICVYCGELVDPDGPACPCRPQAKTQEYVMTIATKSDVYDTITSTAEKLKMLTRTKGEEYANDPKDALGNFRRLAHRLNIPMEAVLMVYLTKHLDSIEHYIQRLHSGNEVLVVSEPITQRIDDAILYMILLKVMVAENERSKFQENSGKFINAPEMPRPADRESQYRSGNT